MPLDTSLAAFYGPDYLNRYVEGIGRTFAGYHDFEHGETDSLYAYRIGEEHFGTLTPIDIILEVSSTGEKKEEDRFGRTLRTATLK